GQAQVAFAPPAYSDILGQARCRQGPFGGARRQRGRHGYGLAAGGTGFLPDVPVLPFGVTGVTVAISAPSAAARMAARAAAVSAASFARKASSDSFTALKVILRVKSAAKCSLPRSASTAASLSAL